MTPDHPTSPPAGPPVVPPLPTDPPPPPPLAKGGAEGVSSPPTPEARDGAGRAGSASPIADLSYRAYDGPLHTRAARWWIVALAGIRLVRKKPGFWVLVALSILPHLILGAILYFQTPPGSSGGGNPLNPFQVPGEARKYAETFFQVFTQQQLLLFAIALMVGAGSIAADNRANALLVYLAKPITKGDYLLGKWMGIFLTLFAVSFGPALLLYLFFLLSFNSGGFFKNEPMLLPRILLAACVPAALHASLLLACSAWSKTPRIAGAIYAGVYFLSGIIILILWGIRYKGNLGEGALLRHLSLSGIIEGLGQNIFHVTLTVPQFERQAQALKTTTLAPPPLWPLLAIAAGLIMLSLLAARAKIRAVEVVRG